MHAYKTSDDEKCRIFIHVPAILLPHRRHQQLVFYSCFVLSLCQCASVLTHVVQIEKKQHSSDCTVAMKESTKQLEMNSVMFPSFSSPFGWFVLLFLRSLFAYCRHEKCQSLNFVSADGKMLIPGNGKKTVTDSAVFAVKFTITTRIHIQTLPTSKTKRT